MRGFRFSVNSAVSFPTVRRTGRESSPSSCKPESTTSAVLDSRSSLRSVGNDNTTRRPADWQSGKSQPDASIRIIEHIAPFGGKDEMVTEFRGAVG